MAAALPTLRLIGHYSRDGDHEHREDLDLLPYLRPDVENAAPIDLTAYKVIDHQPDVTKKLPFYRYIASHQPMLRQICNNMVSKAPIITGHTTLARLWSMFNKRDTKESTFTAHLFKGVIYFRLDTGTVPSKSSSLGSLGNVFKHAMRFGDIQTCVATEGFFGVFQMCMGDHDIFYNHLIDAILEDGHPPVSNLEDLGVRELIKLRMIFGTPWNVRKQSCDLWMVSFISMSNICVGFLDKKRDRIHKVPVPVIWKVQKYSQQQLRDISKDIDPEYFFERIKCLFDDVKSAFGEEITKNGYSNDVCEIPKIMIRWKSDRFGEYIRIEEDPEYDLPEWFVEDVEKTL